MKRTVLLIALVLATVLPATASTAAPEDHDHQVALAVGESGEVAGGLPGGIHPGYFGIVDLGTTGQCTSDPTAYCESVFITVSNPLTEADTAAGKTSRKANLDIVVTPTHPVADFDLVLYSSNADGDVLGEAASSGGTPIADSDTSSESIYLPVVTRETTPEQHYVAHIVYFAAPSDYTMTVDFG